MSGELVGVSVNKTDELTAEEQAIYTHYLSHFDPKEPYKDTPNWMNEGMALLFDNASDYARRIVFYFQQTPQKEIAALLTHLDAINRSFRDKPDGFLGNLELKSKYFWFRASQNAGLLESSKYKEDDMLAALAAVLVNQLIESIKRDKEIAKIQLTIFDDMRTKIDDINGKPSLWSIPFTGYSRESLNLSSDVAAIMEKCFNFSEIKAQESLVPKKHGEAGAAIKKDKNEQLMKAIENYAKKGEIKILKPKEAAQKIIPLLANHAEALEKCTIKSVKDRDKHPDKYIRYIADKVIEFRKQ